MAKGDKIERFLEGFLQHLGLLSLILLCTGLVPFIWGTYYYLTENLDQKPNMPYFWGDKNFLICLMLFPFLIHIYIFFRIWIQFKEDKRDKSLGYILLSYVLVMCAASFSYSLLFLAHTWKDLSLNALTGWQVFAGLTIAFLLFITINCTRIITQNKSRNDGLLTHKDISSEQYEILCKRLNILLEQGDVLKQDDEDLMKIMDNPNKHKEDYQKLCKILQVFCDDETITEKELYEQKEDFEKLHTEQPQLKAFKRLCDFITKQEHLRWIYFAVKDKKFEVHISKAEMIETLNGIIMDEEFYDHQAFPKPNSNAKSYQMSDGIKNLFNDLPNIFKKDRKNIATERVQKINRILMDFYILQHLEKSDGVRKFAYEERRKSALKTIESPLKLFSDDRIDARIREGMVRFSFEMLSFFFMIYLCIGYLFGFLFSFHDRYMIKTTAELAKAAETKKDATSSEPAQWEMPALFVEREYSPPTLPPASSPSPPTEEPTTFFYYNTANAGFINKGVSNATKTDEKKRILNEQNQTNNKKKFVSLLDLIRAKVTSGNKVFIRLVGRADDTAIGGNAYSSNYELSLARAENLKFELIQRLQSEPDILRQIEWDCLAVSNDSSIGGDFPLNKPSLRDPIIMNEKPSPTPTPAQSQTPNPTPDPLENLDKYSDTSPEDRNQRDLFSRRKFQLDAQINRVKQLNQGEKFSAEQKERIKEKLNTLIADYNRQSQTFEENAEDMTVALNHFDSDTDNANKRIVEVYVTGIPLIKNKYKPDNLKVNLMDCIYFAITGYGDIKPVTAYAKFLCILTNIVELFFLVVFFNSLLSLRQKE